MSLWLCSDGGFCSSPLTSVVLASCLQLHLHCAICNLCNSVVPFSLWCMFGTIPLVVFPLFGLEFIWTSADVGSYGRTFCLSMSVVSAIKASMETTDTPFTRDGIIITGTLESAVPPLPSCTLSFAPIPHRAPCFVTTSTVWWHYLRWQPGSSPNSAGGPKAGLCSHVCFCEPASLPGRSSVPKSTVSWPGPSNWLGRTFCAQMSTKLLSRLGFVFLYDIVTLCSSLNFQFLSFPFLVYNPSLNFPFLSFFVQDYFPSSRVTNTDTGSIGKWVRIRREDYQCPGYTGERNRLGDK